MRPLALWLFLPLSACTGLASTTGDHGASADLVNGTLDSGDPSVMRLDLVEASGEPASCTATLVGSQTALTAAHCWRGMRSAALLLASGEHLDVIAGAADPEYTNVAIFGAAHDFAVLHLAAPLDGIEPSRLATAPPHVGDTVTMVGFGEHDASGAYDGLKRSGTNQVAGRIATLWWTSGTDTEHATLSHGDSGGPAFLERDGSRVLAGIASQGAVAQNNFWGNFAPTMSLYARPDHAIDWLTQEIGLDLFDGAHWGHPASTPSVASLSSLVFTPSSTSPSANQPFAVEVTSDGSGAVTVEMWLDGLPIGTQDAPLPLDISSGNLQLDAGHHTLVAIVRDAQSGGVLELHQLGIEVAP